MISSFTYAQTVKDLQNLADSCGYDDISTKNNFLADANKTTFIR
jgi:hypothetical protein